jgi:hypothetical protein
VIKTWNFFAILACACLVGATSSYALSLQDKLSAWPDASDTERLEVSRVLAVVASQGLSQFNEDFFQSCITFASTQSALQPKKIGEIGSMCVAMYFRVSEQNLRP